MTELDELAMIDGFDATSSASRLPALTPHKHTEVPSLPRSPKPATAPARPLSLAQPSPVPAKGVVTPVLVPGPRHADGDLDLTTFPWYFGEISADDAAVILNVKPVGDFLVRASSKRGCFTISYVQSEDSIIHVLLQRDAATGRWYMDGIGEFFPSVLAVLRTYRSSYRRAVARTYDRHLISDTSTEFAAAPPPGVHDEPPAGVPLGHFDGKEDLRQHEYYHGAISGVSANRVLEHRPKGSFLLRKSTKVPNAFVISYSEGGGSVVHVLLTREANSGLWSAEGSGETFECVSKIVSEFLSISRPVSNNGVVR